ncbi:MAG: CoA-binding protein [Desulfosudis oleivorans]|nr:CoA-binding protein [Desulfosudis oleivorans]
MDLKPLFEPKTMAVIGISSSNDRHPANVIFAKNHLRYPVEVYAVNPKGGKLHSETIYPNVADIPRKIDLAVIATRAELVPDVMADCIKAGVKSAAVISGGFTEGGREGFTGPHGEHGPRSQIPVHWPQLSGCLCSFSSGHIFSAH